MIIVHLYVALHPPQHSPTRRAAAPWRVSPGTWHTATFLARSTLAHGSPLALHSTTARHSIPLHAVAAHLNQINQNQINTPHPAAGGQQQAEFRRVGRCCLLGAAGRGTSLCRGAPWPLNRREKTCASRHLIALPTSQYGRVNYKARRFAAVLSETGNGSDAIAS